jgi:hypothetical protein
MERIQQAFDNLKERLNNPLVFSFIISWIFLNWKVTVALLWYDSPNNGNGHIKLVNFIVENTSILNSIVIPLFYSLLYTLFSPIIKNCIVAFQNWNFTWGNNWNLRILNESNIPIKKYVALKENYEENLKKLSSILESESETKRKFDEEVIAKQTIFKELETCRSSVNELSELVVNVNKIELIQGKWIKTFNSEMNNELKENWEIDKAGNVAIYKGTVRTDIYKIENFMYNKTNGWISFALFKYVDSEKAITGFYSFNRLRYQFEELAGEEWKHSISDRVVFRKDK